MKKEKTVKTHTRKTKSGKTVVVRQHTSKYNASEKEVSKKVGAGKELSEVAKKRQVIKDFDALVDSCDGTHLAWMLIEGGWVEDGISRKFDSIEDKAQEYGEKRAGGFFEPDYKKYRNAYLNKHTDELRSVAKSVFRKYSRESGDSSDELKEAFDGLCVASKKTIKGLEKLGFEHSDWVYTTKSGNYRIRTEKAARNLIAKYGKLSAKEFNKLPDSKTSKEYKKMIKGSRRKK